MSEKLDRILEYCDLQARLLHGTGLLGGERARLERLREQLSTQVPSLDDRDPYTLLGEPMPAQVITGSSVVTAELRNASAAGIALATDAPPPTLSSRAKVVARDVHRGIEYVFAGVVVSRVVKGPYAMALSFEATPSRLRLGGRSGVFARNGLASEPPELATERPRAITKKG